MAAMTAVSNIYRAANAVRNHLERTVLAERGLTWTGWVVLWVIWIWGEVESRHVAEAGISKGTLTGVQNTLMAKGLVHREGPSQDARRVLLSLTPEGPGADGRAVPSLQRRGGLRDGRARPRGHGAQDGPLGARRGSWPARARAEGGSRR